MTTTIPLHHGGIMANYRCNASCRHCLYACSPRRDAAYITPENARAACALLHEGGCRSVHIGGGEPFLDFDALLALIRAINQSPVRLDYVETNAFWAREEAQTKSRLDALARAGANALCISLDPFHAEFVPYGRPLFLAKMCAQTGFSHFLWQERFLATLSRLDPEKTHTPTPAQILQTAQHYGLRYGGRAIQIESANAPRKPLVASAVPCHGILSGDHFHVDPRLRFIPPGCTGIAIPLEEVVRGVPEKKYPVFDLLSRGDIPGLLAHAQSLGFTPDPSGYASTCALCFHLRHWLAKNAPCAELDLEHYEASLR